MARLLHVIANPKPDDASVSRRLATHFFRHRQHAHPHEATETLDLYVEDVPMLDAVTAAILAERPGHPDTPQADTEPPPSWALAASDRYTAQFLRVDRVVITTPMWNFGPPAILKAWIDLIVRQGRTFAFTDSGIEPLAPGKRMLLIGARGGVYGEESPLRSFEFLESYLRGLFGLLGVEVFEAVWAENTSLPDSAEARRSFESARDRLLELAQSF